MYCLSKCTYKVYYLYIVTEPLCKRLARSAVRLGRTHGEEGWYPDTKRRLGNNRDKFIITLCTITSIYNGKPIHSELVKRNRFVGGNATSGRNSANKVVSIKVPQRKWSECAVNRVSRVPEGVTGYSQASVTSRVIRRYFTAYGSLGEIDS